MPRPLQPTAPELETILKAPYHTLNGTEIPKVYYPGVEEYYNFIKNSPQKLEKFCISEKTANQILDNIYDLAKTLNADVPPVNLTMLPKELFHTVGKYKNLVIPTGPQPAKGTNAYDIHKTSLRNFRTTITDELSSAYRLPNYLNYVTENVARKTELVYADKPEKVKRKLKQWKTSGILRAVGFSGLVAGLPITATGVGLGITFFPTLSIVDMIMFSVLGLGATGVTLIMTNGVGKNTPFQTKKHLTGGKTNIELQNNLTEYLTPTTASMETYLLTENPDK